jgi:hypothetical protein
MQDRTEEIKRELSELNNTLKMSVQKAIRIGELLTEQKAFVGHGLFLPWLEKNFDMSQQTASNYMRLHTHQSKLLNIGNLSEAYRQIETIEAQEKQSKVERDRSLIAEYRKTGIKPDGWTPALDKAVKDTDDHLAEMKERRAKEEAEREQRAKEYQEKIDAAVKPPPASQTSQAHTQQDSTTGGLADAFKIAAGAYIDHTNKRNEWKEKIRLSDGGKEDAFMDAIIDYLETLTDDNRRIEACNNIIKICRNISVELQKVRVAA